MPRRDNPWSDLGRADVRKIQARRVHATGRHDFYWACNSEGRYALVFQAAQDVGEWGPPPRIQGVDINFYPSERQLQLVLTKSDDWEMFLVLCEDLIQATDACSTSIEVMDRLSIRLGRWQRLLTAGLRGILADTEIRGLIGELVFLRDELLPRFGAKALGAWQGPQRLPQDFVLGAYLFEVKTHLVGGPGRIHIASAGQLWNGGLGLYLVVIPLQSSSATGAVTLPGLVAEISSALADQTERDSFEARLLDVGYLPLPAYADIGYRILPRKCYEVGAGFPRILGEAVPAGVVTVSYDIDLSSCDSFATEPDWAAVTGSTL